MIGTLTLPLAGCFLPNEIIPAAITVPPGYRAGPRHADAALPSVVWWRGFRSKELTDLIEESLTSNFDVAAAVTRIRQADANARVAGAALLPVVDLNGSATRQRASQGGGEWREAVSVDRQLPLRKEARVVVEEPVGVARGGIDVAARVADDEGAALKAADGRAHWSPEIRQAVLERATATPGWAGPHVRGERADARGRCAAGGGTVRSDRWAVAEAVVAAVVEWRRRRAEAAAEAAGWTGSGGSTRICAVS